MAKYQVGVIGAGNMAEALLKGALKANIVDHNTVVVTDPEFKRRQHFTRELGVTALEDNAVAAACGRVILAVKPQVMAGVLSAVAGSVRDDATVISIAAGIRTDVISDTLGGRGHVVRVMPNTPMLVGRGMIALAGGAGATDADMAWTEKLFGACGQTCRVSEPMIDVVTAVSGSGPAYFFYLIEAMIAAGVSEGLDDAIAAQLALNTCLGAGELLVSTGERPEVLRAKVTSPGGTTQAAIESMDASGVKDALIAAIRRAAERSRELGG